MKTPIAWEPISQYRNAPRIRVWIWVISPLDWNNFEWCRCLQQSETSGSWREPLWVCALLDFFLIATVFLQQKRTDWPQTICLCPLIPFSRPTPSTNPQQPTRCGFLVFRERSIICRCHHWLSGRRLHLLSQPFLLETAEWWKSPPQWVRQRHAFAHTWLLWLLHQFTRWSDREAAKKCPTEAARHVNATGPNGSIRVLDPQHKWWAQNDARMLAGAKFDC